MHRVYLDNNATTPLLPEVFEAMRPYFLEKFGNASSIHQQGQQARAAVEHARERVAELLNCRPAEIVFTSGGTEGDNLALFGMAKPGDHIITSAIEHHAVLNACKRLEESGLHGDLSAGGWPCAGRSRRCAPGVASRDEADQHHAGEQRDRRRCSRCARSARSPPKPMCTSIPTRCRLPAKLPLDVQADWLAIC